MMSYLLLLIISANAATPYSMELFSFSNQGDCVAKYNELSRTQHLMLTQCLPASIKYVKGK